MANKYKTFHVSLRGINLDDIKVEIECESNEEPNENVLLDAAIKEIENDLRTTAKLDYYR
jgi:hypothetical protein